MKICRFIYNETVYFGEIRDEYIYPSLNSDHQFLSKNQIYSDEKVRLEKVKLLAPAIPSKIVCVGRNYADHAAELGNAIPKEPLLFLKAPSSIITTFETINIPPQSIQVEHEAELAVVIGRTCKNLTEMDDTDEYIFGFTCLNDVTARDIQRHDTQFTRAKSFDTFCPVGAIVETELNILDIRIVARVNGITKQDGRTSQMVFPVSFLIRYISNQMTLYPGDIVATGTPSGVSKLSPGDLCEVEIEGIGTLSNPVS